MRILLLSSFILLIMAACGTNPVTGKRQVTLMSQAQEISLGRQQYAPSLQSQGGTYVIDKSLNAYVNNVGQRLARHSAQPNLPYEFTVLNNDVPNAWALPGGKIAINRGLLVLLEDEAQLAAVLAHEVVHAAARHGAEQHASNVGFQLLSTIAQTQTDNALVNQAMGIGTSGAQAFYSRENELESDYYGINYMVREGYAAYGAVELQQTFLALSQKNKASSDFLSTFFASHPPSSERVAKNRQRAQNLPTGKRNKAEFVKATQQIRRDMPAYDKHLSALKAAMNKDWDQALKRTLEAIKAQPKEARFYITKGQLLNRDDKNTQALSAFASAIILEPDYFQTHLRRGLLYNKMQQYKNAEVDLSISHRLLPTQLSSFYLGEIAQRNNNRQQAIQYYRQAQQIGGDMGKEATGRMQQLGVSTR
jgi:predicted Zn-dependent protease